MWKKWVGFDPATMKIRTEIMAGITSFLAMSYILAANPAILSETRMDKGALFTTTACAAVIGTMCMALWAKMPFALAPGMGLNAFFTYTVCLQMGNSWQFALTAVFIEGIIFIILTLTKLRQAIVNAIPPTLRQAIGVGIGLFIAFIGLINCRIVVPHETTIVTIGHLTGGDALLGLIGLTITSILAIKKVQGGLLIGILLTTLIGIPMGITHYNGIINLPPSIEPIFMQFEFSEIFTLKMVIVVFTFLFIDMFDTLGTIIGVFNRAGMTVNGRIPRLKEAFMSDAIGTTCGAMLGTSTVTVFVESASGISQGGRSGLTAFTTATCFALALLFSPFFLSIPAPATGAVLILVGLSMASSMTGIDFSDLSEAIPAFICILIIPFAYSISEGIILSMISYVVINLLSGKRHKISVPMYILTAILLLKFAL